MEKLSEYASCKLFLFELKHTKESHCPVAALAIVAGQWAGRPVSADTLGRAAFQAGFHIGGLLDDLKINALSWPLPKPTRRSTTLYRVLVTQPAPQIYRQARHKLLVSSFAGWLLDGRGDGIERGAHLATRRPTSGVVPIWCRIPLCNECGGVAALFLCLRTILSHLDDAHDLCNVDKAAASFHRRNGGISRARPPSLRGLQKHCR